MTNELVIIENNQAVTSSLNVAENFGKEHKHVLDSIKTLIKGVAENSAYSKSPMFFEDSYIHPQNKQEYKMYYMNRDGFTLLAMGFTGKKALEFKLKYIAKFNEMEGKLKSQAPTLPTTYKEALLALVEEVEKNEQLQLENEELTKEVVHKEDVIIGLVDEISLAEKRQLINRVVRSGGGNKARDRWNELYKQFELKYHINLKVRLNTYNEKNKPKLTGKIDYIDKIMNKVPELYEIACKLYENDIKTLIDEMYALQNK